jgi:hypothetical protein
MPTAPPIHEYESLLIRLPRAHPNSCATLAHPPPPQDTATSLAMGPGQAFGTIGSAALPCLRTQASGRSERMPHCPTGDVGQGGDIKSAASTTRAAPFEATLERLTAAIKPALAVIVSCSPAESLVAGSPKDRVHPAHVGRQSRIALPSRHLRRYLKLTDVGNDLRQREY